MFNQADDELIKRLIEEAEAMIEEELQKQLKNAKQKAADDHAEVLESPKPKRTRKKTPDDELLADKPAPKRRGRPKKSAQSDQESSKDKDVADTATATKSKSPRKKPFAKSLSREQKNGKMMVKEAILEFVEREDGVLSLQEVGGVDEPMVTIAFSEQVREMIGSDQIQMVGQSMIHAAIAAVMQRQVSAWHAHVYDEKPKRYS